MLGYIVSHPARPLDPFVYNCLLDASIFKCMKVGKMAYEVISCIFEAVGAEDECIYIFASAPEMNLFIKIVGTKNSSPCLAAMVHSNYRNHSSFSFLCPGHGFQWGILTGRAFVILLTSNFGIKLFWD